MDVWIDGQKYTLQKNTKITRSPLIEFPQHIRTVGQQQRQDRTLISSFVIEEWSEGLGIERMNINIARDTKSFWDVDSVDTRFPSMLVKSP
ncbi:MAG: hypothetical protein KJ888_20950, partial [Gammaproteobacteria bacterium]|nr:hypothetical protein [Gammaproteobacteria bacterium]